MRESKFSNKYKARCEKLRQFLFFEGNYKKRCFLKDNFEQYKEYLICYNKLFEYIRINLYRYILIDPDDDFDPLFSEKSQIIEAIEQLQIFYLCIKNCELRSYLSLVERFDFCRCLMELDFFKENIPKFNTISEKYGLFISDIMSEYDPENAIQFDISNKNLEIYKPYPDISIMNRYIENEKYSLMGDIQKKRFYNLLKKICTDDKLKRVEKSLFCRSVANSIANNDYNKSNKSRIIGLWIWDKCFNPFKFENVSLNQAIRELENGNFANTYKKEDFGRCMKRIIKNTRESIEKCTVVPFKE